MIQVFYYVFWICFGIIFYNYIGYGILLVVINRLKRIFSTKPLGQEKAFFPEVTLVVAAYNEEDVMEEKIANCLSLDYPAKRLSFLFVTDGSNDRTAEIVGQYPQIKLLNSAERRGKTAALNRAMNLVKTPITVFCDANTVLNRQAIKNIVRHYQDEGTGGVAGEKRIMTQGNTQTPAAGEGLYWKYESFLKRLDSELYTVTGAAGELFSIRTSLWEPVEDNVILDDFIISTRVNLKGYRIAYEPEAYASELPSASLAEEKKRKVRISAGGFQSLVLVKPIFNFFKYPLLFFQFFSHRFLRWTLTPLSFPLLLLANIFIVFYTGKVFFIITLAAQLGFYLLALIGAYAKSEGRMAKILKICYYVFFMNFSVYLGFVRFMRGKQSAVWEKAERKVVAEALL